MPTISAPAALASSWFLPEVNTATRTVLPIPWGITVEPRTCWSDLLASIPRFTAASTDSLNLEVASSLTIFSASSIEYCLPGWTLSFQVFTRLVSAMLEALHIDAHAARSARNGAHGRFHVRGGQIRLLGGRDFLDLLARDLAHLGGVRRAAALLNADRLADQHRGGRGLHDEGEAAVAIHRDDHGNRQPLLQLLGLRIELLAELHDVDTLLAQCRTDRWRGVRGTRRHLQLDVALYFLCHLLALPGACGISFKSCLPVLWRCCAGKLLRLFDLGEIQLHRSGPSQDLHRHLQAVLLVVHALDDAVEVIERPLDNAHHFAGLEEYLRPRLVDTFLDATQDLHRLLIRDGRGLVGCATDKPQDLGDITHQVPRLLVHLHLHQHVAGVELAFALALLAVAHFHHLFGGHQDLAEPRLEPVTLAAVLQ